MLFYERTDIWLKFLGMIDTAPLMIAITTTSIYSRTLARTHSLLVHKVRILWVTWQVNVMLPNPDDTFHIQFVFTSVLFILLS